MARSRSASSLRSDARCLGERRSAPCRFVFQIRAPFEHGTAFRRTTRREQQLIERAGGSERKRPILGGEIQHLGVQLDRGRVVPHRLLVDRGGLGEQVPA